MPWLGHVASWAFQDVCHSWVTLRRWRNLHCKNLTKTRGHLGSHLEVIPAPFSRFFIANTLHHRLLIGSLAIARQLGDWFACMTRQLGDRFACMTRQPCDWFACITRQPCDWGELGSALESVERIGRSTFPAPSPAWRERAGVRASPSTHLIRRYSGLRCAYVLTLFTVALRLCRPVGYTG